MPGSARASIVFALAAILLAGARVVAAEPDLPGARTLYAAASYEEALARLGAAPSSPEGDDAQVEQYRALCFLALGRVLEAEDALARLVIQRPLYALDKSEDVSPKFVMLFRTVREKALPAAARRAYAKARQHYDEKDFAEAIKAFKDLASLLADPAASSQASDLGDLKQLSEGFLRLAELEVAAANKAAADAATAEQQRAPRVFTASDPDVVAPTPITQSLPEWRASSSDLARNRLRGVLELLIDDQGRVETASLRERISPNYDDRLLRAAREWKFVPAKRGNQPVRYIRLVEIVLQPQGQKP
jgi:tetratricopeptide (TPR) repeat protein